MADMATLIYDIDSSSARSAAKDLLSVESAAGELASAMSKMGAVFDKSTGKWEQTTRRTNGQFKSAKESVSEYGDEVRNLAAKYNPAINAALQYTRAQEEVARAVALGVISQDQSSVVLQRVATGLSNAAVAQTRFGQASEVASHHALNLGYQINDIGMMMSLGQNPFALMMQQGPQVAQIFSTMAAEGRKIGPTLASAFTSILNPVSLVTLAVIGGTAALYQWATGAVEGKNGAEAFADALSNLSNYTDALNNSLTLSMPANFDAVLEKYGTLNESVRTHIAQMDALNAQMIAISQVSVDQLFGDQFGGVLMTRLDELKFAFDTTYGGARQLEAMINQLDAAKGPTELIAAYDKLIAAVLDSVGGVENLNKEQTAFVLELVKGRDQAILAKSALERLKPPITAALDEAGRLLGTLTTIGNSDFSPTINLPTLKRFDLPFELLGPGAMSSSPRPKEAPVGTGGIDWGTSGGGAGGGGGGGVADEMQQRWDALNEGFKAETALKLEQYNKDLETLKWALDQKKITEQQYQLNRQMMLTEAFGLDYERNLVQYQLENDALKVAFDQKLLTEEQYLMQRSELQHKYYSDMIGVDQSASSQQLRQMSEDFAQMNQLAGGGYDSLLRAQKVFAAASALINAYQGASLALTDPTLTTWGRIAAYGKVLAAGLGAVNAIKGSGGGGGGRGSAASTATAAAAKQDPTKNILVRLEGPDFMVDMAESILQQVYDQSKDGRVIIARDN